MGLTAGTIATSVVVSAIKKVAAKVAQETGRQAIEKFDLQTGTARLERALALEQEEQVRLLCSVVRAISVQVGERLASDEEACSAIEQMVLDAVFRRRFRGFWAEAERSSRERVVMLAAACFVAAEPSTEQERIDRAVLQLLPEDAETLGTLVALSHRQESSKMLCIVAPPGRSWQMGLQWRSQLDHATQVGQSSILALSSSQCIMLGPWIRADSDIVLAGQAPAEPTCRIDLTATGVALHRHLERVDWREIASRPR